ncbi:hypothetical protein M8542_19735 [Amycolatopsis sp. OK19-0408]|uniref:Uncharacterized protein n=1 Tax=Amycolatopsis iheyensis TaxID=2945988 RepID=A0A9X2SKE5_9PSEU|nr:hypothetical protein [Amycolatopsis iheyensis]MCR6485063.1 hypothetical protein [Amycolatopsis iheyensis]
MTKPVTPLDPDRLGAGVLAAAAAELIGPLAPAATPRPLTLRPSSSGPTGQAEVVVDFPTRQPLVLCTVLSDVDAQGLTILPALEAGKDAPQTLPVVTFAPHTAAGTALVAAVPPAGKAPFTLLARGIRGGKAGVGLTAAQLIAAVRFDLVDGVLGRLLTVLLDEKGRIRRTARQIRAMRTLAVASGNALDRIGADLSCARFSDELFWDAEEQTPATRPLSTGEDDASYRARLRVLRGVRLPSAPWLGSALAEFLADVGVPSTVTVDESADPQLIALRLVAPGAPGAIGQLLNAIRRVHLIWPAGSTEGDDAHAHRLLPPDVVARVDTQRAALATWQVQPFQPLAPTVAEALTTLDARCGRLGARPWPKVLRGQDNTGGSRFELGFGAQLAAPVAAQLDAAVSAATALKDPNLVPKPRSADPAGAWLLRACGLRTVEPAADGTVFVSTAPMGPLVVDVEPDASGDVPLTLSARLVSPTDPDHDVPVVAVIAALAGAQLTPAADPAAVLAAARSTSTVPGLDAALDSRSVPKVTDVAAFARQLGTVSPRDYVLFDLGATRTAAVIANSALLSPLFTTATAAGASSVVALATGAGTLALVFGVTGLPLAGANLAGEHTLIHRWQVRGPGDQHATLSAKRGAVVTIPLFNSGISVVSCVLGQRSGANDPYTWRPALPDGALLTLRQYEHLLNIVELVTPIGVRADTFAIRRRHVDVDGSGAFTGLDIAAARAYRHYRLAPSARAGQGEIS